MGEKQYGKVSLTPALQDKNTWEVVYLDCTGPLSINYENESTGKVSSFQLNLITMVDACLGWAEFAIMSNKTAKHTAHLFNKNWFCWYPCPAKVVFDNGTECIGFEF